MAKILEIKRISDLRQKYPAQESAYLRFQENIRYKNLPEVLVIAEGYLNTFDAVPDLTVLLEVEDVRT